MTARVLLLNFDDEAAAESFVQQLSEAQRSTHVAGWGSKCQTLGLLAVASANVEAMVARPSREVFCRCKNVRPNESYKSSRFGWWVHRTKPDGTPCNKPSWWAVRDFIKNMLNGHNDLLPELLARLETDTPAAEIAPASTSTTLFNEDIAAKLRAFIPVETPDQPAPLESDGPPSPPVELDTDREAPKLRSWPIRSSADPNRTWDVTEIEGRLVCPCPPYLYKGQCPHVAEAEKLRAAEDSGGDNG